MTVKPHQKSTPVPRRTILRALSLFGLSAAGVATLPIGEAMARVTGGRPRRLDLRCLHTDDRAGAVYWADGRYRPEALRVFNRVLRDWRTGDLTNMDPQLFDVLYALQRNLGTDKPFHVISGYRSPRTNARLASNSNGVAKRSLHMQGKAIDIRVPGYDIAGVRDAALALKAGGVGLYSRSSFVHIDTGRVRQWGA